MAVSRGHTKRPSWNDDFAHQAVGARASLLRPLGLRHAIHHILFERYTRRLSIGMEIFLAARDARGLCTGFRLMVCGRFLGMPLPDENIGVHLVVWQISGQINGTIKIR